MSHRAVFLDRDGPVHGEVNYLSEPEQLALLPGAAVAIRQMKRLGLKVVVVTNQSAVARGYLSEEKLSHIHKRLREMLAEQDAYLDAIYYCPEMPDSGSPCRKPRIGMMKQAAEDLDIDLKRSYVVGDMASDMEMGRRAGAKTILVLTGYGEKTRAQGSQADHVAGDLSAAVGWIESDLKGE